MASDQWPSGHTHHLNLPLAIQSRQLSVYAKELSKEHTTQHRRILVKMRRPLACYKHALLLSQIKSGIKARFLPATDTEWIPVSLKFQKSFSNTLLSLWMQSIRRPDVVQFVCRRAPPRGAIWRTRAFFSVEAGGQLHFYTFSLRYSILSIFSRLETTISVQKGQTRPQKFLWLKCKAVCDWLDFSSVNET